MDIGKSTFYSPFSFLNDFPDINPEININFFTNELLVKNLTIKNQRLIKKTIINSKNKFIIEKHQQFIENKKQISKIKEISVNQNSLEYRKIINEINILESDLIKESIQFSEFKKLLSIDFYDFKNKLTFESAIVNLVSFRYYGRGTKYGFFLLKKDSKYPKFIPLFEEKHLTQLLAKNKQEVDSTHINNQYTSKAISDLFLKPLENELKGVNTVYFSPSGLGHQIDFAALPISENETFGEKYKVHILSSPAEMIDFKSNYLNTENDLDIVLYGGIDYNKTSLLNGTTKKIEEVDYIISDISSRSNAKEFGYLNGTKNEVDIIESKATKNNFKTMLFEGREATEESIKQLDGRTRPFALHLATHGFFFPDPEEKFEDPLQIQLQGKSKIYKASDDPMMRSGLILAGANKYWGKPFETLTTEDGILTASEISNLDLSACQLVVLSACETGLGEIKGSEGVFGLQRAFKMAGVKNIIMSLWKVPDTQTAMLFDVFYEECFNGKSIHEAFRIAQSTMKEKYPPYYWAGFVLLE